MPSRQDFRRIEQMENGIDQEEKNQGISGRCIIIMVILSFMIGAFIGGGISYGLTVRKWTTSGPIITIQGGEDADPAIRAKRDKVRQMMIHAWKGYVDHAWGSNELRPISKGRNDDSIFGQAPLGATIVDSIDTLYIMGLMDEYNQAKNWIEQHFKPEAVNGYLSVFEVTIRFLGGLLSTHALTKDNLFYYKAVELGNRILPAFDTPSGIPNSRINLGKKKSFGDHHVLAEWGTLSLEFNQLAEVSGYNPFRAPIQRLNKAMENMERPYGLFPVFDAPLRDRENKDMNMAWGNSGLFTLAEPADSFYEYLLKSWLQSDKSDEKSRKMYVAAMEGATKKLVQTSETSKLIYLSSVNNGQTEHKMSHLACFTGGMLALSGHTMGIKQHLELGEALTATCHQSYNRTVTKLGPEAFWFDEGKEAEGKPKDGPYILRPEVIESYFILWRTTHDPKYREWGWEAVEALEAHCRIPSGGYSGLRNVNDPNSHDDIQQSFFLAETLKYLYLLFSDDRLISLDQWVFNTEAHPLPIIRAGLNDQ